MRGQELEDGVSWGGGQCLEHPDEHRWWGKLCPSPWTGREERVAGLGSALVFVSRGRVVRLTLGSFRAREAGSFSALSGTASSCLAPELLRGTGYL